MDEPVSAVIEVSFENLFCYATPKADIKLADSRLITQRTSIHILLIAELFQTKH